jgi:hypothetical protein
MKKNKIYLLISIISITCFFGTAALCNQCAPGALGETEDIVEEDEIPTAEEVETEDTGSPDSDEEEDKQEAEESAEEETSKEEGSEGEETAQEEEEEEEVAKEAPTITLEIYEGPTYSSADDVCYYRVRAVITGSPTPVVEFSKDDSNGAWGSRKAQVNLNDPSDTYTLTASATNTEGTDDDSITLSWGCPIPNNPPEISEITLIPGNYFPGIEYSITAVVTDPDGDNLNYDWSVTGGSILDNTVNPMKWTTPVSGIYEMTLTVDDGKGGSDTITETVDVIMPYPTPQPKDEWGHIIRDDSICRNSTCKIMVGDYINNRPFRGFVSFDISGLSGRTVLSVGIILEDTIQWGNPSSIISIIAVEIIDWGNDDLELEDYFALGTTLDTYTPPDFIYASSLLKDRLQDAIDSGKDRFQIRISNPGLLTNNNNAIDAIGYPVDNIILAVASYIE